ncbi:glycoside hydrolase family 3 C-terminal domain-containing protein [Puniceicoccaceae bacterium K14]|nr:glycoside hydrolase family 3 C-terminal domain-containing protein [Puniceicoccaceae bacterium K14]
MRIIFFHLFLGLLIGATPSAAAPDRSELDAKAAEQAAMLVSQMTLDEKVALIEMDSGAVERLDIPAHHWWNEALHGIARRGKATQFPIPLSMASTWNPRLIHKMGTAISDEARALHHSDSAEDATKRYHGLTIWSPVVNIARDPRWGRTEEGYGEDPHLVSRMGVAFVEGLQGDNPDYLKTVATVKHFVVNNTEHNRLHAHPSVTERSLREFYLPAYRTAIDEAGVESFMTAYNGVNGAPCSANRWLLTDLLRDEWGFNGTVVTDVGVPKWMFLEHKFAKDGMGSAAAMLTAGVDVYCGGESDWAKQAVESGLMDEAYLDRAVTRSLATRIKLGLHRPEENNPYSHIPIEVVGSKKHTDIARQIAREGIVMLQNNNNVLPATPQKYDRIVIGGRYSTGASLGAYSGTPTHPAVSPAAGLKAIASQDFEFASQFGGSWVPVPEANLNIPGDPSTRGLKGEYFANTNLEGDPQTTRVDPIVNFEWPKPLSHIDPSIPQPNFSARWTGQLTPSVSGKHVFSIEAHNSARVWINGELILDIWHRKAEDSQISGEINLTAGKSVDIKIEYVDKTSIAPEAKIWVKFKWVEPQQTIEASDPQRDLFVYVGGLTHEMAHESHDLMDLSFPAEQIEEIRDLAKTYPNIVVVVNSGTAVELDELRELVPGILVQWFPGQEGGTALAEVITGLVNPSGHLPFSIYTDSSKLPNFEDYEPQKGRTYMYATDNITYAFGEGLSYTEFEYTNFQVFSDKDKVSIKLNVSNIGDRDGDDIVQIYASNLDSLVYQPIKQLKAFKRVTVPAKKSVSVEFEFPIESLAWWNELKQEFVVDQGRYSIQAGQASNKIVAKKTIQIAE